MLKKLFVVLTISFLIIACVAGIVMTDANPEFIFGDDGHLVISVEDKNIKSINYGTYRLEGDVVDVFAEGTPYEKPITPTFVVMKKYANGWDFTSYQYLYSGSTIEIDFSDGCQAIIITTGYPAASRVIAV